MVPQVLAQTSNQTIIQTEYLDTYSLGYTNDVHVSREIKLTNQTAELYVSEYELTFTSADRLTDLVVLEEGVPAVFEKNQSGEALKIRIKLSKPAIGKGASKVFRVDYQLKDYLNRSGVSSELFIPLSRPSSKESLVGYRVVVKTPVDFPDLGISKPRVTVVDGQTYEWGNLLDFEKKALYISFSKRAYYKVRLNYVLTNRSLYPRQQTIPLVPDGTFQKMYLEELYPQPESVSLDADSNYLATYTVPANSTQKVLFSGYVELFTSPREAVRRYFLNQLTEDSLSRYLTQESYWHLESTTLTDPEISQLSGGLAIYDYVVNKLEYDTGRINQELTRMGAEWIYRNPTQAVCMEYTDLFIALSREKGIPAREVVGYAITNNQSLLPSSFLGDVLHAWPEHYDRARQTWMPIDPTWADTSGIEYYSSFDLSHISLVYHGKDPNFPLPPGVYKSDPQSQDVLVQGVATLPKQVNTLNAQAPEKSSFRINREGNLPVVLESAANHYLYETELILQDRRTRKIVSRQSLSVIVPLSNRKINLSLPKSEMQRAGSGTYVLLANNQELLTVDYTIKTEINYYFDKFRYALAAIGFIILTYFFVKWRF